MKIIFLSVPAARSIEESACVSCASADAMDKFEVAHGIPCMFDLFPLTPKIPQNVRSHIFRLQRDSLGILQPLCPVFKSFCARQQSRSRGESRWIVCVRIVRVRQPRSGQEIVALVLQPDFPLPVNMWPRGPVISSPAPS